MNDENNSSLGRGMLVLAFIIVLAMTTWFFSDVLNDLRNPNQQLANSMNTDGLPEVMLQRNRYGHYIASGSINGQAVEYMLDTGATDVAIPATLAEKMNLKLGPEIRVSTANGEITARMSRLDRVDLGAISLRNIKATINPYMDADDEILLGMSFLKKLEMIQRGDTLILRQYQLDE